MLARSRSTPGSPSRLTVPSALACARTDQREAGRQWEPERTTSLQLAARIEVPMASLLLPASLPGTWETWPDRTREHPGISTAACQTIPVLEGAALCGNRCVCRLWVVMGGFCWPRSASSPSSTSGIAHQPPSTQSGIAFPRVRSMRQALRLCRKDHS